MGDSAQEELVGLIFGENPPDGWRDMPEFQIYLSELGQLTPERLAVEPERVANELAGVQSHTQELAFSNYKTFIQTSSCSKEVFSSFTETEAQLDQLLEKLPAFRTECSEFEASAQEISSHRRLTSLSLARHTTLLEVLELPQLMETVVRNGHYDEALQLSAYVARLVKRQPGVPVLEDIGRAVSVSLQLMLQQLLAQLRAPVQLPQCLKVISYLRRLDVFGEVELRLKFLQARETWLDSVVGAIGKEEGSGAHLTRTMEVMRVHLFDIVTQYRAIFTDEQEGLGEVGGQGSRLLFTSWLSRKVSQFLKVVKEDLASGAPTTESLLGQAMYFGLSFARVGFDFRPLLAPIFLEAVERQLKSSLTPDSCLSSFPTLLSSLNLARLTSPAPLAAHDPSSPPMGLIEFTPLAHLANSVLGALNDLRACAPLSICFKVTVTVEEVLAEACRRLLDWQSTQSRGWSDSETQGFSNLVAAASLLLLPHIQAALHAVFPPEQLSQVSGLSRPELSSQKLGYLDQEAILSPLSQFLPAKPDLTKVVEAPAVEYVADRMGEINAALEATHIKDEHSGVVGDEDKSSPVEEGSANMKEMEEEGVASMVEVKEEGLPDTKQGDEKEAQHEH